jgi:hypothetical protein
MQAEEELVTFGPMVRRRGDIDAAERTIAAIAGINVAVFLAWQLAVLRLALVAAAYPLFSLSHTHNHSHSSFISLYLCL